MNHDVSVAGEGDVERRFVSEVLSTLTSLFLLSPRAPAEWGLFMGEILERIEFDGLSVLASTDAIEFQLLARDRRTPARTGYVRLGVPYPLPAALRGPEAPQGVIGTLIAELNEDVMSGTRQHLVWT